MRPIHIFILFILFYLPLETFARIKLITLPVREKVEIQLEHASITLVEEERIVPLVQGRNQIDFSWANTSIDANTIVFRVLEPSSDKVQVLAVSYPPNENALVWDVSSAIDGAARVRISYVIRNLNKNFSYRALTSQDEKTLTLSEYIHIQNNANEAFDKSGVWAGLGPHFYREIGINETKKVLMYKHKNIPVVKTYTADINQHGYLNYAQKKLNIPMHYVLTNSKDQGLGQDPMPYGKMRIFQQDSQGSSAFIGEDWGKFTPLDDEMPLYLGLAQDIVVKRTIDKNEKNRVMGNLYEYHVTIKYEIENFKDKPVTLDIIENIRSIRDELYGNNGRDVEWEIDNDNTSFAKGYDADKSTYEKAVFHVELPVHKSEEDKQIHTLSIIMKNEWR